MFWRFNDWISNTFKASLKTIHAFSENHRSFLKTTLYRCCRNSGKEFAFTRLKIQESNTLYEVYIRKVPLIGFQELRGISLNLFLNGVTDQFPSCDSWKHVLFVLIGTVPQHAPNLQLGIWPLKVLGISGGQSQADRPPALRQLVRPGRISPAGSALPIGRGI